jgi:predicted adenylyl cyclase CyaB
MDVRRNLEIKARLSDRGVARRQVQQISTDRIGQQVQTDTYFHCRSGRLKLREITGRSAQLIWYDRPDSTDPKTSRYHLADVNDPETVKAALAAGLGVKCIVKKRREIFLYRYVRIHLDQVYQLGDFIELEAVMQPDTSFDEAERLLRDLIEQVGIDLQQLVESSYCDLLLATK